MKQSVSLITLGVSDYARAKAFYEAIGWSAARDVEDTAFFQANGVVLVLWGRDTLAMERRAYRFKEMQAAAHMLGEVP